MGSSTAYFLTRHPLYDPSKHQITLLEASRIAGGASGKAGGLLALWAYPQSIVRLSYRLHAELASTHNGAERWGYRTEKGFENPLRFFLVHLYFRLEQLDSNKE